MQKNTRAALLIAGAAGILVAGSIGALDGLAGGGSSGCGGHVEGPDNQGGNSEMPVEGEGAETLSSKATGESSNCDDGAADGTSCDDGDACTKGDTCKAGACIGAPVACLTPSKKACADNNTLRISDLGGRCVEGTCVYDSKDIVCDEGCDAATDSCKEDACKGVYCSDSPANMCASDGESLVAFQSPGVCENGACLFQLVNTKCAKGCLYGACLDEPCAGVKCDAPPASTCLDENTVGYYSYKGSCEAGQCSYTALKKACANGCDNGECVDDPCASVTCVKPPADHCLNDGFTLESYQLAGACKQGLCEYEAKQTVCPMGCAKGACQADPCAQKTCASPPATSCDESKTTLLSYSAQGTCSAGQCSYTQSKKACPLGCENGACKGDPCAGVVCAPASATCDSNVSAEVLIQSTCTNGQCSTSTTTTEKCEYGCDEKGSACQPSPLPPTGTGAQVCKGGSSGLMYKTPQCKSYADWKNEAYKLCESHNLELTSLQTSGECAAKTDRAYGVYECCPAAPEKDLCAGVVCDAPAPACTTERSSVTYSATCDPSSGKCVGTKAEAFCAKGETCDEKSGACATDLCYGVKCTPLPSTCALDDSYVVYGATCDAATGNCVDSKKEVFCEKGQVCDKATVTCVTADTPTPNGDTDLCAGVTCKPAPTTCATAESYVLYGSTCDKATGKCVEDRKEVFCAKGEVCDKLSGSCKATDLCANVKCQSPTTKCTTDSSFTTQTYTCNPKTGSCESTDTTGYCGKGQVCDKSSGTCVAEEAPADLCANVKCQPASTRCDTSTTFTTQTYTCNPKTGSCESTDTTGYCGKGQVCDKLSGSCKAADLCANVDCPAPETKCSTTSSTSFVTVSYKCDPSTGSCAGSKSAGYCGKGETCSGGACKAADLCANVDCPAPETKCSTTSSTSFVTVSYKCDPSTGSCAGSKSAGYCGKGETCSGGACKAADLCAKVNCPAAETKCATNTSFVTVNYACDAATGSCTSRKSTGYCSKGEACSGGGCQPLDLCANVSCPKATLKCATSTMYVAYTWTCDKSSGNCVQTTADGRCPKGTSCDPKNAVCR
jgi:hypothetical protein